MMTPQSNHRDTFSPHIQITKASVFIQVHKLMNALAVQNLRHKCDLGNKNDSVLTRK